MDTASLLIALLRASGIAARYVYGTIEVPMDQVMNWVGGFTNEQAAINFIGSGGTPVTGLVYGGKIVSARMEHTWVEAYVDFIPSRGAVNKQGDTWIPLDGSFKQYTYTSGIDLKTAVPFDAQAFVNQLQSTATINEQAGYVANIDSASIQNTVTDLQSRLQSYLSTNLPNATVEDLIGKKTIKPQTFPILAGTLRYKTVTIGSRSSTLSDALRHKLSFEVTTEAFFGPDLTFTANLVELVGKRVTLSYVPATSADQQTINQYGGLYSTPAYLIQVKPQIKVEGVVKAEGKAVGFGVDQNFTMTFSLPNIGSDLVQNTITAGGYYAIGLVPDRLPRGYDSVIQQRNQRLNALVQSGANLLSDEGLGEELYLSVMTYFWEVNRQGDAIASSVNIVYAKQPGEGIFGLSLSVGGLFGVPTSVRVVGVTIDIDRTVDVPASKDGDGSKIRNYMNIAGMSASGLEHGIIEQLYNVEAISAVKVIYLANLQGLKTELPLEFRLPRIV
ncbi:MAG: transglutaminase domain-containing protein [Nitrospirae bacterium]|nr:transglutaminase domain-containing protein [Nitrospirota bacterium]